MHRACKFIEKSLKTLNLENSGSYRFHEQEFQINVKFELRISDFSKISKLIID